MLEQGDAVLAPIELGGAGSLRIDRSREQLISNDRNAQLQGFGHLFLKSHRAELEPVEVFQIFILNRIGEDNFFKAILVNGKR